ncbi:MAG: aminotransferase class I/II-fold pyridoxal phosphate-dependent enzyme, partial [Erysipelotrichales bacterium]
YSKKELEKLCDTSIKALFVVNPNNPASIAINKTSSNNLVDIVKNYNKDLMIISDDVYGTFVKDFTSLMAKLPYNTIGVYSYSKYF